MAPMVHWPEVMVTYEHEHKMLFSADAFGTFGALSGNIFADEYDYKTEWPAEARRYYSNIVGKYGPQTLALLKKAANLDIDYICPLHGPIWREKEGISWIIDKYSHWAGYIPESDDVVIQLADPSRAGVIVPCVQPENEDVLMLIMPMLLNE